MVLFVDAAHFVLSPFIGMLWCFARTFIKSPAGRKRFNVLAALDAITHELIMVTNDKYINAFSFCELLWDINKKYTKINIPITLVLDNARYQKCACLLFCTTFRYRAALFTGVFTQFEPHRTFMEICEEKMFILKILP